MPPLRPHGPKAASDGPALTRTPPVSQARGVSYFETLMAAIGVPGVAAYHP